MAGMVIAFQKFIPAKGLFGDQKWIGFDNFTYLSWVVLGGVMIDILSPSQGILNQVLNFFGIDSIFFLGSNKWFQPTIIMTDVWKGFGFGTVVYLAAITGINLSLYEAATMDGANRFQKMWHVTLPGIRMIVVLMCVLSLGNVLNAGFDQVLNLYSPQVYETGDIIDTFIYLSLIHI